MSGLGTHVSSPPTPPSHASRMHAPQHTSVCVSLDITKDSIKFKFVTNSISQRINPIDDPFPPLAPRGEIFENRSHVDMF